MGRTILLKVVLPPCIAKQTPLKRSQGVDSSLFLRGCDPSHGTGDILGWLSCAAPQQTVSSFTAGLLWLTGSSVVHLAHYQFIMPTLWASLDTWMHHDVTFYCNQPNWWKWKREVDDMLEGWRGVEESTCKSKKGTSVYIALSSGRLDDRAHWCYSAKSWIKLLEYSTSHFRSRFPIVHDRASRYLHWF